MFLVHSRRSFLKLALAGAATASVAPWLAPKRVFAEGFELPSYDDASPVARILSGSSSTEFNGDEFDRAHEVLWDKDNYLRSRGGKPAPSETAPLVIVGGGLAGLTAAYHARDLKPVLLDSASRFGGNSKAEIWEDSAHSIGAAYISTPDPDSDTARLLGELGLLQDFREEKGGEMSLVLRNRLMEGFWSGASDPARAEDFKQVLRKFGEIRDQAFPEVPFKPSSGLSPSEYSSLDQLSFARWLDKTFASLHPHVKEFFQEYCWSSFGGSTDELSAAQALNFLASDLSGTIALPGGNAAVAQRLYDRLQSAVGPSRLRSGALVIDVVATDSGVHVTYETRDRALKTISAKACIVASPKFVAQHLISGLEDAQKDAMARIQYRAYLVANVLLKNRVPSPGYDVFRLTGEIPGDAREESKRRAFTDVIYGSWAGHDRAGRSVLTLYKPQAYDGARHFLFSPFAHDKHQGQIRDALPELLSALGLGMDQVAGIRMTRWGHSIPLAQPGLLTSGTLATASRPVGGRIFFANQDNLANPCFETATGTARTAVELVRKTL